MHGVASIGALLLSTSALPLANCYRQLSTLLPTSPSEAWLQSLFHECRRWDHAGQDKKSAPSVLLSTRRLRKIAKDLQETRRPNCCFPLLRLAAVLELRSLQHWFRREFRKNAVDFRVRHGTCLGAQHVRHIAMALSRVLECTNPRRGAAPRFLTFRVR